MTDKLREAAAKYRCLVRSEGPDELVFHAGKELDAVLESALADDHREQLGDMSAFDYKRLVTWMRDSNRKDPSAAFTAGSVRTAATAVLDSGILQAAIADDGEPDGAFDKAAADKLAWAVAELIGRGALGSRSIAGDALLDYLRIGHPGGFDNVPQWMSQYKKQLIGNPPQV